MRVKDVISRNNAKVITPAFNENYKLILIDLVGSGKSDELANDFEKYSSLQGYADDILDVCENLQLRDITMVAHSCAADV